MIKKIERFLLKLRKKRNKMVDDKEYTDSFTGSICNFITSTVSTGTSIMDGHDGKFMTYRCWRCNQPVGKFQKTCHNCKAELKWDEIK